MPTDPNAFAEMVTTTIKLATMPLIERVAVLETKLAHAVAVQSTVEALRDRVVVMETKAAIPPALPEPVDLRPLLDRVGQLESRPLEIKAAPAPTGPSPAEIELTVLQAIEPLRQALAAASERIAGVEARAGVPGPPGAPGKDGTDGTNGKDGADGVELDDLAIEQTDERTAVITGTVGARVKTLGTLTFPCEIYRGVYVEGKTYDRGDCATFGGSEWHCNEPTATKPGDGSKAWTLKVKRGRDGKDGKDAEAIPVVRLAGAGR